ncbi:glycoside hydrolase family 3 protein [Gonapodya prolifera JEL478]|uniref:beta-glucosidase n=1 Tax=Gonapodya prolifera (strain JEL478) TaxID=1344416 RepID=A0A139AQL5_GONPJ|nr:glycoside hydrolase family 3 protein [Gonapodya prolifera JEL478]|eukprot:KXS19029.1 glycoside hydrolase family 3 protein [Gonapodya prolifera JEL478]
MKSLSLFAATAALIFPLSSYANSASYLLGTRPIEPSGDITWENATVQAQALAAQLSVQDKVDLARILVGTTVPCFVIPEKPQIGFKGFCILDSVTGVGGGYNNASTFSAPVNLAATFDKDLMRQQGELIAEDLRSRGVAIALAPVLNLQRSPAGGRNFEFAGADPVLSSIVNVQHIRGTQSKGVMSVAKHYILNEQEHNRFTANSVISPRAFHEVYLRPFKAVVEAGVGAIMCSYNPVNGVSSCENPTTLGILKNDLGFKGFVMSDYGAAKNGSAAANAGMDMILTGDPRSAWANLTTLVQNGTVPESRLTDMATRILAAWIKLGQREITFPLSTLTVTGPTNTSYKDHIRTVGAASSVLLKNEQGALPLTNGTLKTVAVIGENAMPHVTELNRCLNNVFTTCIDGHVALGWGSGTTKFPYLVDPLTAITEKASARNITVVSTSDHALAAPTAKKADIAVVFVFASSGEGANPPFQPVQGHYGDRYDLKLWQNGDALVKSVADVQKTVVVITGPGAVDMPWIHHPNVVGVIHSMFPGQESGNAIADVLFGDVNPSGRLPFTIAESREHYAADVDYTGLTIEYKEGTLIDYRWFEARGKSPLFAFGHGLSYTTFQYSQITVTAPSSDSAAFTLLVTITNTGNVAGHEVVQLYVQLPEHTCPKQGCAKELRDFERISLVPHESRIVRFRLYKDDLSYYDESKGSWALPFGDFCVSIGASSSDIRSTATFTM